MRTRGIAALAVSLAACGGSVGDGGRIVGIGGGSCNATALAIGDTVSGTLTALDCRALDTTSIVPDSFSFRAFGIQLATDSIVLASVRATAFEPALQLFDAAGRQLGGDETPRAPRTFAELLMRAETGGPHTLRVRGTSSTQSGAFVLSTTRCGGRRLTVPDSVTGQSLAAGDCVLARFSAIQPGFEDSSRVDVYLLRAGPADSLLVRVRATLFTPALNLRGPTGRAGVAVVGDSTGVGVSELVVAPDSLADYMVIVGARRRADAGTYSLVVVQATGTTPRRGRD